MTRGARGSEFSGRWAGSWGLAFGAVLALGCGSAEKSSHSGGGGQGAGGGSAEDTKARVYSGARVPGGDVIELRVEGARLVEVGSRVSRAAAEVIDVTGQWVTPAFIEGHVHLTYYPVTESLPATGIVAALDLAAPLASLESQPAEFTLLASGPMITRTDGYPTQGWGSDGYGFEVETVSDAEEAVRDLVRLGADVIKVPLTGAPTLTDEQLEAIVRVAHEENRLVVAHALGDADARRAADAGVDALAHTPTEALEAATVDAWSERVVISTLGAFGGGDAAVDNLARLHEAGARVIYGTDLGNSRTVGVSASELELLGRAGLSPAEILESITTTPADVLGFDDLGRLEADREASFVFLDRDPLVDIAVLTTPTRVVARGKEVRSPAP